MMIKYGIIGLFNYCVEQNFLTEETRYTPDGVSKEEFSKVVSAFNKAIAAQILEGYAFTVPFGTLRIIKRRRELKDGVYRVIDWKASKENRQKIIDRGGIPYNKETAPHGEHWFIYFTDGVRYKWEWKKRAVKEWFHFIPCINNKRMLGRVVKRKKEEQNDNYYVSVPKNYIKPTYSFEDCQNIQTP